jgi:hypothetical protein
MMPHSRHTDGRASGSHGCHGSCGVRCSIVPPYIHEQVILNGTERARSAAASTLLNDSTIRVLRASRAAPSRVRRFGPRRGTLIFVGGPDRTICDAHHRQRLPGDVVRVEGADPNDDVAVNEAYDGLGSTVDLLYKAFERNSIDGSGLDLLATVHFDREYDNAFWDGSQMVFGDGDGEVFKRFTIAVDIIGHELAHGVTEHEAGLVYVSQPGALNESISDVMGSLVKQYTLNQTADTADWLIGEGLFTDAIDGVALRSMAAPGTAYNDATIGQDPQPAHMRDYVRTTADSGGVHINSGIPNHAFYNVAMQLGGFAWERAGVIWYDALIDAALPRRSSFLTFARLTIRAAARRFGSASDEAAATRDGWAAVGIGVSPTARLSRRFGSLASIAGPQGPGPAAPWRATARRREPRAARGTVKTTSTKSGASRRRRTTPG